MKILLSLLMAVMFLGGQAVADDGDICDGQVGSAYGLCQAYCIAMDCAGTDPLPSDEACSRVSDQYEKVTGFLPPCCSDQCPLWTKQELDATYNRLCCEVMEDNYDQGLCENGRVDFLDVCYDESFLWIFLGVAEIYDDQGFCEIQSYEGAYVEITEDGEVFHDRVIELTREEYDACRVDIANYSFTQCVTPVSD